MSTIDAPTTQVTESSAGKAELPQVPHCKLLESGLSVPVFLDDEWIKHMKDEVKPRPDDIWTVSYPKSGTTWIQQIVRLIINRPGKEDGKLLTDAVPWVEAFNKKIPRYDKPLHEP